MFFITGGLRFDPNALLSSASTIARMPMFLLITAGVLSVIAFPLAGLVLLRRSGGRREWRCRPQPAPATPVLAVEDRPLCGSAMSAAQ